MGDFYKNNSSLMSRSDPDLIQSFAPKEQIHKLYRNGDRVRNISLWKWTFDYNTPKMMMAWYFLRSSSDT